MAKTARYVRFAALLLAFALRAREAAAANGRPTVLVIDSYGGSWETARQIAAGLRRDVHGKNGAPLEFVEVSLRPRTEGVASVEEPLLDYVNALFREEPPALVVALGRAAGRFVIEHRDGVFPRAPSLTLLALRPDFASLPLGANDAFVTFEFDLPWVIETLLNAFPSTRRLFVVFGHTAAELRIREAFKPFFAAQYPTLAVMWANDLTIQGLGDSVAQLPSDSLVVYGGFDVDAANERVEDAIALPRVLASASVPTVAVYADKIGSGVAATAHVDVESYVREASGAARELLAGTPASQVRTSPAPTMGAAFDARALARFGVDRSHLPATATFVNAHEGSWSSGGLMRGGVALVALQGCAAIALAFGWRRARARRAENLASYTRSARLRETLVGERTEEAREALARVVTRLVSHASSAPQRLTVDAGMNDDLAGAARELGAQLDEALTRIAPPALDDLGLEAALRVECAARRQSSSLDVLFAGRAPSLGLSRDLALAIFRSLQRMLDACAADTTPRTVRVTLVVEAERAVMKVHDPSIAAGPALGRLPAFLEALGEVDALVSALGGGATIEDDGGESHVRAWVPASA